MGTVGTPTRNRGRRRFWLAVMLVIGIALMPAGAGAVHDLGVFELDGNVANDAAPGDDWANVVGNGSLPLPMGSALSADFEAEATEGSIFTGGGSKDISDISDWQWKDGPDPSQKTDLLDTGAALYQASNGDPILYFFADRRDTNGDAKVGFWFFRSPISLNADGTFNGVHTDGDILIESDFTQGGANITNFKVYEWQNGALNTTPISTGVDCGSAPAGDAECGINNHDTYAPTWPFSGETTPGAFFEGGLNLKTLFGSIGAIPCFSTFLAESRSSGSSVNSILEDFVLGEFASCGSIKINKQTVPPDASETFHYTTTGGSPLANFSLTPPGTASVTFSNVKPGAYSVDEDGPLPAGWSFTSLDCTKTPAGETTTFTKNGDHVDITLGYGGHVECTYVNTFTKQTPTVTTDIHAGAGAADTANAPAILQAPIGSTVHDKATVAGVEGFGTPTGSVTFRVYSNMTCTGDGTAAGSVTLNGDGVAHPSNDAVVPVGGLSFKAHYGGNAKYLEADGPCEPLTATKLDSTTATTIHDAAHGAITSAPIGTTVHDSATVTGTAAGGTPTGDVSFTVYKGNTACDGVGESAGTVALDANGVAHPSLASDVPVGGLSYKAHYNGSDTYKTSDGPCEPLEGTKHDSNTATTIHASDHSAVTSAPIGTVVHDLATVTGNATGGTPTGNVTFTVYLGNTTCQGTGASAGTVALDANGVAHPSLTSNVPVGGLSYKAHYNGSGTYNESTGECEPLAAGKLSSTTVTDIHNASHQVVTSVPAGTTVHDKATVSGALGTPTGSVTFKWFTNGTCTGAPADTSSSFALSGGSVDATSFTKTPGVGGSFAFQATYSGDDTYNGSTGACEPLTVTKIASTTVTDIHNGSHQVVTSVAAGTTVHDKATVSGALGTPTGSVTFKWFTNGNCSGTAAATSDAFTLASGSVDATSFAFTTPSNASGSFSFQATYSGNDTYNGSTGACEPLTSTFTPPPPAPPAPAPEIDLAVTKVDTPDPATLNGQITYTMVVTNNGPDTATGVTAADPLPAGTTFVSVSTTQGTCANNGGLIQCSIGTLAKGASATITLVVTATRTGTINNEVTVVGNEPEKNTANNRATATTLVPAPLVPPTPKPTPKPTPVVCVTFTVSTKTITVGKAKRVLVRVKRAGKAVAGAKVRIRGAGINKTVRTGKNGVAVVTVTAKRPGILRIDVIQKAACGSKRIGVVGAFEPPVTG